MSDKSRDIDLDVERHYRFPMSVGYIAGCLSGRGVREFLLAREVTNEEIDAAEAALYRIAGAFYRDPK